VLLYKFLSQRVIVFQFGERVSLWERLLMLNEIIFIGEELWVKAQGYGDYY